MFQSARLRLTAWYLVILMLISILFSCFIYSIVSSQIGRLIHEQNERIQHFQDNQEKESEGISPHDGPPVIPVQELQNQETQLLITLIIVNGAIFVVAGAAAYFLAGRTLRPIKVMIDEQNQFISNASHELRTPIATMRAEMETSLLEQHISDTAARELAKSYLEELGSLQSLTNKLLKLAQIHTIHLLQHKEEVLLPEVVEAAYKKVLPLAKRKHITVNKDVKKVTIHGEKTSLIETFVIVLENAIKYSFENTTIAIVMTTSRQSATVSVTDQGIGITKEDIPHIFDRFYRADKAHSQDGFGLGLSIAKKNIASHDGSIHVESTLGKGTTFTISLPLKSS